MTDNRKKLDFCLECGAPVNDQTGRCGCGYESSEGVQLGDEKNLIPLDHYAEALGLSVDLVEQMVKDGKIEGVYKQDAVYIDLLATKALHKDDKIQEHCTQEPIYSSHNHARERSVHKQRGLAGLYSWICLRLPLGVLGGILGVLSSLFFLFPKELFPLTLTSRTIVRVLIGLAIGGAAGSIVRFLLSRLIRSAGVGFRSLTTVDRFMITLIGTVGGIFVWVMVFPSTWLVSQIEPLEGSPGAKYGAPPITEFLGFGGFFLVPWVWYLWDFWAPEYERKFRSNPGRSEEQKEMVYAKRRHCPYCKKPIPGVDQDKEASAIKCRHCSKWVDDWQTRLL